MTSKHITETVTLREALARTVRDYRQARGWTQAQLAEEMSAFGFPWKQVTVAEIEGTRRRGVSTEELFGLALTLEVPVVSLISVRDDIEIQLAEDFEIGSDDVISLAIQGRLAGDAELVRMRERADDLRRQVEDHQRSIAAFAAQRSAAAAELERIQRDMHDAALVIDKGAAAAAMAEGERRAMDPLGLAGHVLAVDSDRNVKPARVRRGKGSKP